MLITIIALSVAALSVFFMLGGLRVAAQDTVKMLSETTAQARRAGELLPRVAFVMLWTMIFAFSYF